MLNLFLFACVSSKQKDGLKIYGYEIGDTLTNEFEITKVQDYPFRRAKFIEDRRFEVSLIDKYISAITFEELTQKEHDYYKKMISGAMKFEPEYFNGVSPYDVKIEGEIFYWNNTKTGISVKLGRNPKKDTVLSYLSIYNHNFSDSLLNVFVPNIDTVDYEIMDIED